MKRLATSYKKDLGSFFAKPGQPFVITADFLISLIFFAICYSMSPHGLWARSNHYLLFCSIFFSTVFVFVNVGTGITESDARLSIVRTLLSGFLSFLLSLGAMLVAVYLYYYEPIGRLTIIWGGLGAFAGWAFFRCALIFLSRQFPYRFSIVGDSSALREIKQVFQSGELKESSPYRYVACESEGMHDLSLGHLNEIVFSMDSFGDSKLLDFAIVAMKRRLKVVDEIEFYSSFFEKVPLDLVGKPWVIQNSLGRRRFLTNFLKRSVDVVLGSALLLLASPVMLAIALAIKLSSNGPVLFNQTRMGRYFQPFKMYKFRTMYTAQSYEDARLGFTKKNDARVTFVGKIIRPLHLDELPQLVNIILGHMSIVGPRPETQTFAQQMAKDVELYEIRYMLRPGLTGHAQIMHGYALDSADETRVKLSYDLYYLCNYSLLMDAKVILRTFFVVLGDIWHKMVAADRRPHSAR